MKIEFRAYLTVHAPGPLPPVAWDRLAAVVDEGFGDYGPVFSYWPDRPSESAEVVISTDQRPNPALAAKQLVDVVDGALVRAELADCYVAGVELERVPDEDLVPA